MRNRPIKKYKLREPNSQMDSNYQVPPAPIREDVEMYIETDENKTINELVSQLNRLTLKRKSDTLNSDIEEAEMPKNKKIRHQGSFQVTAIGKLSPLPQGVFHHENSLSKPTIKFSIQGGILFFKAPQGNDSKVVLEKNQCIGFKN